MAEPSLRKRIWGWFFFDWASQPYNTLLLTFIFAPYVKELLEDGAQAQAAWGFGIGTAGFIIALLAPSLGAISDTSGNRMRFVWLFSAFYVIGSFGLWWAEPGNFNLYLILVLFAIGMIGMEFATIFTNSMLPDLGPREEIGRISGNGWAFGYLGGLVALILMLTLFAEGADTGKTLIGISPLFGLDPEAREGTRFVGPLTAIWYVVFMIPFFIWVRDPKPTRMQSGAVPQALMGLWRTIGRLPKTPSLFAYLTSSMFYRDALNGMYTFGGIYAAGVLGWSVVDVGVFGILAIVSGALFCWLGGKADARFGPKPVIVYSIYVLLFVAVSIVFVSRGSVYGIPVDANSSAPDIAFYIFGALIGAAGGTLQSSSRGMMVRQADPVRIAEAFGLYALAGKATSFLAPTLIGVATAVSGSQQIGVSPLIALFLIGLILLRFGANERRFRLMRFIPFLGAFTFSVFLAACGGSDTSIDGTEIEAPVPPANLSSSNQPAKFAFGAARSASRAIAGALSAAMPRDVPAGSAQLARDRADLAGDAPVAATAIGAIPNSSISFRTCRRKAAQQPGWNGLYVGDMSQPRGGPMLTGHAQPPDRARCGHLDAAGAATCSLSAAQRESISSISLRRSQRALT